MIGTRVRFQTKRGYIRYIGPVETSSSSKPERNWFGIEWDKDGEGLHDGSCRDANNNVLVYFSCPKTRGSFVKPDKVSLPLSFPEAYALRYHHEEQDKRDKSICGLSGSNLGSCDILPDDAIFQIVTSLNVSQTLFSSWNDVFHLASAFPALKELIASENCNLSPGFLSVYTFPQLSYLVLNKSKVLPRISTFFSHHLIMPNLTRLHLCDCGLVDLPDFLPDQVEELDVSFNVMTTIPIHGLPRQLRVLNLSFNPFSSLGESTPSGAIFLPLEKLFFEQTFVLNFKQLESLSAQFPRLTDLTLSLEDDDFLPYRNAVIVRFPNLQRFNKSALSSKERHRAEVSCLKLGDEFPGYQEIKSHHAQFLTAPSLQTRFVLIPVSFVFDQDRIQIRHFPTQTRLDDLFTVFNRLFVCLTGKLAFNGSVHSKAHCVRDNLLISDILREEENATIVISIV